MMLSLAGRSDHPLNTYPLRVGGVGAVAIDPPVVNSPLGIGVAETLRYMTLYVLGIQLA